MAIVLAISAKPNNRECYTGKDDLGFCGAQGGHLAGHKLRDRNKAKAVFEKAGLLELRFHDLEIARRGLG